jgi:hypothetical protein
MEAAEIMSKFSLTFNARHSQWTDTICFRPGNVANEPQLASLLGKDTPSAMGYFLRVRTTDSGLWVLCGRDLHLVW